MAASLWDCPAIVVRRAVCRKHKIREQSTSPWRGHMESYRENMGLREKRLGRGARETLGRWKRSEEFRDTLYVMGYISGCAAPSGKHAVKRYSSPPPYQKFCFPTVNHHSKILNGFQIAHRFEYLASSHHAGGSSHIITRKVSTVR